MAECFYCGSNEKLTRAHLFQRRIRDALPISTDMVSIAKTSVKAQGIERDIAFSGDAREIYVKNLCIQCNSGWMESIEKAAGPVLESILRDRGFPQPRDLLRLAHWATLVGALATQTVGNFDVPVEHRRKIRFARTGQPSGFGTHLILTNDHYPHTSLDFMRFEVEKGAASWYSALHAGPAIIISADFRINMLIAHALYSSEFNSYLNVMSSNLVYAPGAIQNGLQPSESLTSPSHHAVQEIYRSLSGNEVKYVDTQGGPLVDLKKKIWGNPDYPQEHEFFKKAKDMRNEIDLSYLASVF